jgi:hypothetical protein
MKKRSIVIVLAVALLFVFAMVGSALAYDHKAAPSVVDDPTITYINYPGWVDGQPPDPWVSDTYNGYYYFHVEWSLTAGEPLFYQIQFCPSGDYPNWVAWGAWHKITKAELNAGALTTIPFYYEGLDNDGWRVEIVTNRGAKALFDYSPEWGA